MVPFDIEKEDDAARDEGILPEVPVLVDLREMFDEMESLVEECDCQYYTCGTADTLEGG